MKMVIYEPALMTEKANLITQEAVDMDTVDGQAQPSMLVVKARALTARKRQRVNTRVSRCDSS